MTILPMVTHIQDNTDMGSHGELDFTIGLMEVYIQDSLKMD